MSRKTPLDGAERKGREAFRAGLPRSACPYEDKRKWSGRLTWSRSFIRAWEHGWDEERAQTLLTEHYANMSGRGQPPPQPR